MTMMMLLVYWWEYSLAHYNAVIILSWRCYIDLCLEFLLLRVKPVTESIYACLRTFQQISNNLPTSMLKWQGWHRETSFHSMSLVWWRERERKRWKAKRQSQTRGELENSTASVSLSLAHSHIPMTWQIKWWIITRHKTSLTAEDHIQWRMSWFEISLPFFILCNSSWKVNNSGLDATDKLVYCHFARSGRRVRPWVDDFDVTGGITKSKVK